MISLIILGSDMRATPPSRLMSEGTRSRACGAERCESTTATANVRGEATAELTMTAQAPAASAMRASSALTTSTVVQQNRWSAVDSQRPPKAPSASEISEEG
jgi:hypothetical protein